MAQRLPAIFGRFKTEQLRSSQGKNANASLHSAQLGESGSFDRQAQFSDLLVRMQVNGVPYCDQEIDQVRTVDHLSESEREIALEIFRFGYEAAEKEQRQDKMWAYQRLLRKLLLDRPLDQPIPLNERSKEIPREVTGHVAEPSVTQQSPKHGDTAPLVRTASVSPRVLRYALCSIGVLALLWTAFAFRSPTPAAIEPLAERASVSAAEPGAMRNAIVDQVATSSKSPATAKLDTPGQAGKIKSATKVANQATTVDAARGGNREREPARDSLPIYQTGRRILLRDEPRFGAAAQIMLDRGARLIVLEIDGKWLKVKTAQTGAVGFVREEFVTPVTTAPASVTSLNRG